MKPAQIILSLFLGLVLGALAGSFMARERARIAVIAGPDSDNYRQARSEIAVATAKLRSGNTNVLEHLTAADAQIEEAQQWTKRFLGRK
jgi:hypothetical protein